MESEQTEGKKVTIWNKNFVCIIIANFMMCSAHASVNPLVATYTKYLNTSAQLAGFLAGMFFAVSFCCHPFAGPAMTKLDKRRLLVFVFLLGAIANLGYSMFHSIPMFIAFRFISGVQYSLVGPLIMALASDHLPIEKLAQGLGIYGIGGAIGNAVAPSLGSAILALGTSLRGEGFGFTLMFLCGTTISALAVIPSLLIDPDKKTKEEIASTGAWYKNIFTVHVLPPMIVLFLVMISYATINTYIFEFSKEQGIAGISSFYIALAIALAVSRPMSGFLTTRFGVHKVMFPALAVFAVALLVIGFSTNLLMALVGAVLAAIGFGSSQPSLQAMCMQSETPLKRGVASNTMYMGIDLGLFFGPFLGGLVYAKTDYATMYKTGVVPVCIAIVLFIVILPIHKKRQKELGF